MVQQNLHAKTLRAAQYVACVSAGSCSSCSLTVEAEVEAEKAENTH